MHYIHSSLGLFLIDLRRFNSDANKICAGINFYYIREQNFNDSKKVVIWLSVPVLLIQCLSTLRLGS